MQSKEQAFQKITELVERFTEQYDSYKQSDYNETLTRRDFIDPFFKALGWDTDNEQGYAETYREVIHEVKQKVKEGKNERTKTPDYAFRLNGGKYLFFVEAKKPSVFIKEDITAAYQLRRYGWSARMGISIITDFEEFSIYDCTRKPIKSDKASLARIRYLTFKDYLKEFDFIWNTFSKEHVLKGGFDKFVQSDTYKKGTATVDKEFLLSLDTWRTYLATSISWNNKNLDEDEINFAVQQTIDRIIFLRIAEARNVEPDDQLKLAIKQGDFYKNLFHQFQNADEKYNSGLFDFKKDKISSTLKVDNKVIRNIIEDLYYPKSEYEFGVMPVEILGTAYEQFLGKQIKVDKAHRAHIEEKPEVRKAGGVYYTPQYIVDYIVKNTVGKLVEGKKPGDIAKLKIVDPACGSGSFLLGAYDFLLNYHLKYYHDNPAEAKKLKALIPSQNGKAGIGLTTAEKKRILTNNIYGVDIDVNAVEVTKLSLLLKCMEGETEASIATQMKLFHERVLPSLENNIKAGNSLIDTDYYSNEFDFGDEKKVKPFNWQKAFPDVFKKVTETKADISYPELGIKETQLISRKVEDPITIYSEKSGGGFDVVIGNPPYGALFGESELNYFKSQYKTSIWRGESYLLFIESGLRLLKINGILGFIIPDTLLNLGFTQSLREYLLRNSKLKEIVSLPSNVFAGATVDTILLFTEKKVNTFTFHKSSVDMKVFNKKTSITVINNPDRIFKADTKDWYQQHAFNLQTDTSEQSLIQKIDSKRKQITDIAEIYSGIKTYEVGKGNPIQSAKVRDTKPFTAEIKRSKDWKPFYDGKHIGRYQLLWKNNNWINYGQWLAAPRDPENFVGEKILIRKITGNTLIATYIPETSYCNTLLFVLKLKDKSFSYKSILAILNSSLIGWYFRKKFQVSAEDTFPQIMIRDILQFPIPEINSKNNNELSKNADQLLKLNEEKAQTKLQSKIEELNRKIEYCEEQINIKVYTLYGLEKHEIEIVEENEKK